MGIIRLSKSSISSREINAVNRVLNKEYLGMGEEVMIFENMLKDYFKNNVVCVSSGTAALHLACQSIGLKHGDQVLVQSITYVSSFQAISATGATPIPCEVDPNTLTIDTSDLKKKINKRTKAIMPVHYAGAVGDLGEIYSIARKNNLRVIEDSAHAFGTIYKNKPLGNKGDIICFSFDGIKNITSGEGGCIVSSDKKVINHIKDARLLGVSNDTKKRYSGKRSWTFNVYAQGWRYHMSNIMAAIGIEQFKKFKKSSKKRQNLAKHYNRKLKNNAHLKFLPSDYDLVVPHIYPVIFTSRKLRDYYKKKLEINNVQTGLHYKPNHTLDLYRQTKYKLPISDSLYSRVLTLPLHLDLSKDQIDFISSLLE